MTQHTHQIPALRLRTALAASVTGVALVLGGCASNLGANEYERGQVGQVSRVESGVVIASRAIIIEGRDPYLGGATGAVIGGVAGSQVGGGDDERAIAGVAGAVIGGIVGSQVEKAATKKPGFAYTVQLDKSGDIVTITQGGDIALANGTPVFVEYGARPRVIPQAASVRY